MQMPNFPNQVFLVTAQPSAPDCGHPKVRITSIPAKYNAKSVSTLNGRRLKLDQFGKYSIYARSVSMMIVTGYTQTREEALALADRMCQYMRDETRNDLEKIHNRLLGLRFSAKIEEREYAD